MNVSYNKLFKLLIDRGMKKQDLQKNKVLKKIELG